MGKTAADHVAHVAVRATPRAARPGVAGVRADGVVLVRVAAAPVDGAANTAVARVLADAIGVRPGAVRLVSGAKGRDKRFAVDGIDPGAIARWIGSLAVVGDEGKHDV